VDRVEPLSELVDRIDRVDGQWPFFRRREKHW
jgi:hypothetical protein